MIVLLGEDTRTTLEEEEEKEEDLETGSCLVVDVPELSGLRGGVDVSIGPGVVAIGTVVGGGAWTVVEEVLGDGGGSVGCCGVVDAEVGVAWGGRDDGVGVLDGTGVVGAVAKWDMSAS